jgi:diacylglycerol O-acyltransferase
MSTRCRSREAEEGTARIDRLGALDRLMLGASRRWPQEICALAYFDASGLFDSAGRFRIETVRDAIGSKLHLVPRFRQVVRVPPRGLGGPVWIDADGFDLAEHVRLVELPLGSGEAELLMAVEGLRRQPLDTKRPLWAMWFVTGLGGNRVALFVKVHHALADGTAVMRTIAACLDRTPDADIAEAPIWTPVRAPSARGLRADERARRASRRARLMSAAAHPQATIGRFRAAWPATRELLAGKPSPKTSLDRMIGLDRTLAVMRTTLDEMKAAAEAHAATVNDVFLAATAGGLRALLRSRHEHVETTMHVYVPISLRGAAEGPQHGNLIAQMAIPVPVGISDPERLLERIVAVTSQRKARPRAPLGPSFAGRLLRRLTLMAATRQRVNATTANIRGPSAPLYLAGAQMLEVFPVVPLIANEPIGVGAISYAGAFNLGVVADRQAVPDLDVFVQGMRVTLDAYGVSTKAGPLVPVATASDREGGVSDADHQDA